MDKEEAAAAVRAAGLWVLEDTVFVLPAELEPPTNGAAPVIRDRVLNVVKK